jgi:hypothetical protein
MACCHEAYGLPGSCEQEALRIDRDGLRLAGEYSSSKVYTCQPDGGSVHDVSPIPRRSCGRSHRQCRWSSSRRPTAQYVEPSHNSIALEVLSSTRTLLGQFSMKAKAAMEDVEANMVVVELDKVPRGRDIQMFLGEMTGE